VPALRVTYGLPEENARFLDALAEVLALSTAR
jgi:histidinol-phosphate/aromatic aminotransferase/cobyric acid decarboxylase-like protein